MNRLAALLLAGATIVAAQTTPTTTTTETAGNAMKRGTGTPATVEMQQITEELKLRLQTACENAGEKADAACQAALECQKQIREKSGEEATAAIEARRAEARVRLQGAIDALDRASEKVGTQVEEARARIQDRLQEKRAELVELQKRILERKEAHEMEKVVPEVPAE